MASMTSTYLMSVVSSPTICNTPKCLQTLKNVL